MKYEKYPVVSESGRQYYVTLTEDMTIAFVGFVVVKVYVKRKGIFGRDRFKRISRDTFNPKAFNHDIVAMMQRSVHDYEKHKNRELAEEIMKINALEKFHEWDGDCR